MECTDFTVYLPGSTLNITLIYCPPDTSVPSFVDQLTDYMEQNVNQSGKMLLLGDFNIKVNDKLGDFNIKVNDKGEPDTITFSDFLESFGMCNRVFFPTHRLNNTLNLLVITQWNNTIANVKQGRLFSDHHTILFDIVLLDCAVDQRRFPTEK